MVWNEAFLAQARSDLAVLDHLDHPDVERCHHLHYLQMATEKLAKAWLCDAETPPEPTHLAFVRMLQSLKGRKDIRIQLKFRDSGSFTRYINSLLDLAAKIESLAPAISGFEQPNAEYPWKHSAARGVVVPADFDFPELAPGNVKLQKLMTLIRSLMRTEI